jgi:folate-binding protein YgfZ
MSLNTSASISLYTAATSDVAIYDNAKVGRLKATGEDALDLLNRLSTNLVLDIDEGQGTHTVLTTDRGRILDIVTVTNAGGHFLILTSPGEAETVVKWLHKYTIMEDLEVENITNDTTLISMIGPGSLSRLENLSGISLSGCKDYNIVNGSLASQEISIIVRHMGNLPCFDILAQSSSKESLLNLFSDSGIASLDSETYNAIRVENAIPSYGREIGDRYNPLEAGLIGSINFQKGCYIGQEVIARLDTYQKVQRRLVKMKFSDEVDIAEECLLTKDEQEVGRITSFCMIPSHGEKIGLGYVRIAFAEIGNTFQLSGDNHGFAEIVDLPQLFGPGQ